VLETVRVLCSEGKSAYTRSIAQYLNMDEGNVSRALGELMTEDLIVKTEKVGKTQPYSPVNHEG
jgi:predicted transcriptional regulator